VGKGEEAEEEEEGADASAPSGFPHRISVLRRLASGTEAASGDEEEEEEEEDAAPAAPPPPPPPGLVVAPAHANTPSGAPSFARRAAIAARNAGHRCTTTRIAWTQRERRFRATAFAACASAGPHSSQSWRSCPRASDARCEGRWRGWGGEEEVEEEEEEMANVTLRVAGDREEGPDKLDKSVEAKSTTSSLWLCSSLVIKETPPMRLKPMKAGSGTGGDVSR
jgi:hypothetical protein